MNTRKKKNTLREHFDQIPYGEAKKVRANIKRDCGISGDVWYNWLDGTTMIPKLAKKIVSKHFKKPIETLFP